MIPLVFARRIGAVFLTRKPLAMNPFASSALPASDCATDAANAAPASDPAAAPLDEASAQAPGNETAARTADAGETPENGVSERASS